MSLYTKQEVEKTDLQKQVAKNLQDKSKNGKNYLGNNDLVEDSAYLDSTKHTTSLAWAWVLILLAVIAVIVYSAIKYSTQ